MCIYSQPSLPAQRSNRSASLLTLVQPSNTPQRTASITPSTRCLTALSCTLSAGDSKAMTLEVVAAERQPQFVQDLKVIFKLSFQPEQVSDGSIRGTRRKKNIPAMSHTHRRSDDTHTHARDHCTSKSPLTLSTTNTLLLLTPFRCTPNNCILLPPTTSARFACLRAVWSRAMSCRGCWEIATCWQR